MPFLRKYEVYKGEAMNKSIRISGLVCALMLASNVAGAAGLGRLTVQSALGQPLRAEIELLSVSKDELGSLTARLASPDAFRQARIDRTEAMGNLRFAVDQRPNGQPIVRITSATGVSDPFLDLLIELSWNSGRMIREYTILLDPLPDTKPVEPTRTVVAPEAGRPVESKPATAPVAVVAQPAKPVTQAAPPAAPVAAKRYGPVKAGETLRGIAGKVKPSEVTLEQMMAGLYQANKGAFASANMNRLKRGQVLNVPTAETALTRSPKEAARMVQGHTNEWHAYRRKLASMAGTLPPGGEPAPLRPNAPQARGPAPAPPRAASWRAWRVLCRGRRTPPRPARSRPRPRIAHRRQPVLRRTCCNFPRVSRAARGARPMPQPRRACAAWRRNWPPRAERSRKPRNG